MQLRVTLPSRGGSGGVSFGLSGPFDGGLDFPWVGCTGRVDGSGGGVRWLGKGVFRAEDVAGIVRADSADMDDIGPTGDEPSGAVGSVTTANTADEDCGMVMLAGLGAVGGRERGDGVCNVLGGARQFDFALEAG